MLSMVSGESAVDLCALTGGCGAGFCVTCSRGDARMRPLVNAGLGQVEMSGEDDSMYASPPVDLFLSRDLDLVSESESDSESTLFRAIRGEVRSVFFLVAFVWVFFWGGSNKPRPPL